LGGIFPSLITKMDIELFKQILEGNFKSQKEKEIENKKLNFLKSLKLKGYVFKEAIR